MRQQLSIVTVNLNNASGLEKTISSVLSQTFKDYEFVVIDGGSVDGSLDIVKKYSGSIAFWSSAKDNGIYEAMNKGVRAANGSYLLFLNSGDVLNRPTVLAEIFGAERTSDIVYGNIDYVYSDGSRKLYRSLSGDKLTMAHFFTDTIAHPAAFIRRELFDSGLYDESLRIVADNKFFYERVVFQNCSVEYLDLVVTDFDMTGVSSQRENWKRTNEERAKVINELLPPRIRKDYDTLLVFLHSPLLQYMPVLNKTTGFHRFIAWGVGVLVRIYATLRVKRLERAGVPLYCRRILIQCKCRNWRNLHKDEG